MSGKSQLFFGLSTASGIGSRPGLRVDTGPAGIHTSQMNGLQTNDAPGRPLSSYSSAEWSRRRNLLTLRTPPPPPAAPQVVSFSFDVGNGPVELTVRADAALNDDQWHRVMAERNVKEAVLQLDQTYRASRQAPAQGHTRLELFSQLYVGKTPPLRFDFGTFFFLISARRGRDARGGITG